jgi:hypothetical protein
MGGGARGLGGGVGLAAIVDEDDVAVSVDLSDGLLPPPVSETATHLSPILPTGTCATAWMDFESPPFGALDMVRVAMSTSSGSLEASYEEVLVGARSLRQ